MYNIQIDL